MPNRRPYDLLLITKPEITEEEIGKLKTQLSETTSKLSGQVGEVVNLGKRKLAFRLKGQSEGVYLDTKIEIPPDQLVALKKALDFYDSVLRFMVTHAQAEVSHGKS